jgi:transcriptional regulator with XRE-family HTH domain
MIADRLKYLRVSTGLTQAQLASKLSIQQSRIAMFEAGTTTPKASQLLDYANYFGVSLDYIFGRTDDIHGGYYDEAPEAAADRQQNNPELAQFIEMCFDPSSSANSRLKETLLQMLKEVSQHD